jgi:hypothetical protein
MRRNGAARRVLVCRYRTRLVRSVSTDVSGTCWMPRRASNGCVGTYQDVDLAA